MTNTNIYHNTLPLEKKVFCTTKCFLGEQTKVNNKEGEKQKTSANIMTNNITKKRQKKGKTVQVIIIIIDTKNNLIK
jgi:hypothetical protein